MAKIASYFKRGTQNWTISGDVNAFEWRPAGGNPTGHLSWQDAAAGNVAYWQAPVKYLGNLRAFINGTLSFDWFSSGGSRFDDADLVLNGGNGVTLVADVTDPGSDWSHVSVRLGMRGHWHIGTMEGPLATGKQIAAVLRDVAQFQIRAEHINGNETGGLDNVVLLSKPQPDPAPDLSAAFETGDQALAVDRLGVPPIWHGPDTVQAMLV
ncbi:laminin B domain-containing protein [Sphingomonas sp.]|uniref:laminin B domain-containing protein n=1 Tax=Sphingomonas sp. TaxID=28214 RepID=UPI0035C86E80